MVDKSSTYKNAGCQAAFVAHLQLKKTKTNKQNKQTSAGSLF